MDAHTHPVWAGERVHEFAMKVTAVNVDKSKYGTNTDKFFSKELVGSQGLQHFIYISFSWIFLLPWTMENKLQKH